MSALLTAGSTTSVFAPTIENTEAPEMALVEQNSVKGIARPETPENSNEALKNSKSGRTYGSSAILENGKLIGCLISHESSGDPKAEGDAGEKGILQFMPKTFKAFCVDKYGLKDDIWDVGGQVKCADMMISEGLIRHWTTRHKCL